MSLPRYPEYKDSGVEWLGEVPGHWLVAPLKRGYEVVLGKMLQNDANSLDDELVPYLRAANIKWEGVDISDIKQMWASPREVSQLALSAGDLLISEGGDVGRSAIWQNELDVCCFQNSVNRVRPRDDNSTRFLYYWISTIKDVGFIDIICNKSTIAHFTAEKVAAVPVPFPTPEEQQTIATFLDRETGKIDALIAEQQRLVALLAEKRQAVISHAVTKGITSPRHSRAGGNPAEKTNPHSGQIHRLAEQESLNPLDSRLRGNDGVAMKDSGIEWLGEVPAHWEVRSISSLCTKITNGYVGPTRDILVDDGVRYLQSLHIKGNRIKFNDPYFVTEEWSNEHQKSIIETGDVLIVQTGDIGQVAVVTDEFAGCNCHALIIVAPKRSVILGAWLSLALNSDYGFHSLLSIQTGALHPHLNCGNVKDLFMPIPPLEEQQAIATFLNTETAKFDTLTAEANRAITLLQERRSALISAAVTGKIDVRGKT